MSFLADRKTFVSNDLHFGYGFLLWDWEVHIIMIRHSGVLKKQHLYVYISETNKLTQMWKIWFIDKWWPPPLTDLVIKKQIDWTMIMNIFKRLGPTFHFWRGRFNALYNINLTCHFVLNACTKSKPLLYQLLRWCYIY